MANYFVEVLNELNIKLNTEEARNRRLIMSVGIYKTLRIKTS
jgi:hypothetical protein